MRSKVQHPIALLCLAVVVCHRNFVSAAWSTPELIAATTPDVSLEVLSGRFGIGMNEEIIAPFTMVIINYNGNKIGSDTSSAIDNSQL